MKKLTDKDFDLLLPVETFKFGETQIKVKPIPIFSDDFKLIYLRLKDIEGSLKKAEITLENFPYKLPAIFEIVINEAPDILALILPIDPEDIKKLPGYILIEYLKKFIDINSKSFLGMEKNSNTWAEILKKGLDGATLICSMFSSAQDTESQKLKPGQPVKSELNSVQLQTEKQTDIKTIIKE